MEQHINDLLDLLEKDKQSYARFINTLSFMEYIGARKIMKSQHQALFTTELIEHVSEEIRHAFMLKKVVRRLHDELDTYAFELMLAPEQGKSYMLMTDSSIATHLKEEAEAHDKAKLSWINYLYTTLLVEERAMTFYPVLEESLRKMKAGGVISAIIKDEEKHLNDIREHLKNEDPSFEQRMTIFREFETKYFGEFIMSCQQALAGMSSSQSLGQVH